MTQPKANRLAQSVLETAEQLGHGKLKFIGMGLFEPPDSPDHCSKSKELDFATYGLTSLPEWVGQLTQLQWLNLSSNQLMTLPKSLGQLPLRQLSIDLSDNPLVPELAAAHKEGSEAIIRHLRAEAKAKVILNEAKLIFIGEGEVGKSCLLGALRGDPWKEGCPTTHGISPP